MEQACANTSKSKGIKAVLSVLLLAALFVPHAVRFSGFADRTVNGVALPKEPPALSIKTFTSERFQRGWEAWALKRNGLWGTFVRAANQIYYSVFGQISSGYNQSIIVGNDDHLFQPMYLSAFNRNKIPPRKMIEKRIASVARLQETLKKHGKTLLVLLSPNAIALYPDIVPAEFNDPSRDSRKTSYSVARPLLDKYGVNYIDSFEYFESKKKFSRLKVFESTGSHWNQPASCEVTSQVLSRLGLELGKTVPNISCGQVHSAFPPPTADVDLVEIANLLFEKDTWRPAPVAEVSPLSAPDAYRPRTLFVGTSFLFALTDLMAEQNMLGPSDLWFYYREQKRVGEKTFHALKKKGLILSNYLQEKDAVILEVNQASPGQLGFGFIEDALRSYKALEKQGKKKKK